jgi:acyl-CoA synthetase (AMP-forming)/AMP-acid ligase II
MRGWNFADVWEAAADAMPSAVVQVQGERRFTWAEFDRRADGIARTLLDAGLGEQDKVAQYLYNCPEYLESMFGMFKAGLVPVNTNYRYGDDELVYLWDNADAAAVVFHGVFAERVERLRARLPAVRAWLHVDDGSGPRPSWALPYEVAAKSSGTRVAAPWGRDGDHLYLLFTGGTTGMPKGVMWRQDDLLVILAENARVSFPDDASIDHWRERVRGRGPVCLPAAPLMHGTGAFSALSVLTLAGTVVTLEGRRFDPAELLDTVSGERIQVLSIVGDAFAKPILAALDEHPGRWDLSSLFMIVSSGVMWSARTKEGLLGHHPGVYLVDQFASSEALGMGASVSTGDTAVGTARFKVSERTRVVGDDGRFVEPGSDVVGMVAIKGRTPVGYYKDPEKSARTFRVIGGERYSVPGDYATVEPDGTIKLLGRGSVCINTGGEKVYPEEVEEAIKEHADVRDAVAVGVPDDRFGEAVVAVVEPVPGSRIDEQTLIGYVKRHLAAFKAPKHVIVVASIGRAPNGKVDYRFLRDYAIEQLHAGVVPQRSS